MEQTELRIEQIEKFSDDVLHALNRLMPQLHPDILHLTEKDFTTILEKTNLFVAKKGEEIVGTISLVMYQTPSGKRATLEDLVVDEGHRGEGIAKQLITYAVGQAREKHIEYIDLTSRPTRIEANKLYQQMGFEKRETNVYRILLNK